MGWQWGGGWLASGGFSDFADLLVHGWDTAALAGVIVCVLEKEGLVEKVKRNLCNLLQHQVFH